MSSSRYVSVQEWMIDDLNLGGNELMVFALIYGFSSDGKSEFHGSYQYMMKWAGVTSRQTMLNILKKLIDRGCITKRAEIVNGVQSVSYSSNYVFIPAEDGDLDGTVQYIGVCPKNGQGVQKMDRVSNNCTGDVQNLDRGCPKNGQGGVQKMDTITIYNNTKDKHSNINNTYVGATKAFIYLPTNTKDEYPVLESFVAEMKDLYPNADVEQELRKMRGWLIANKTRRKTVKGMKRFITSWLGNAQDSGRKPVRTYSTYSSPVYDYTEQERAFAESEMPF